MVRGTGSLACRQRWCLALAWRTCGMRRWLRVHGPKKRSRDAQRFSQYGRATHGSTVRDRFFASTRATGERLWRMCWRCQMPMMRP